MFDRKIEVPTWQDLALSLMYIAAAIIFGVYLAIIILVEVSFLFIKYT